MFRSLFALVLVLSLGMPGAATASGTPAPGHLAPPAAHKVKSPTPAGVAGAWLFDEGSGSTAADTSGNGDGGTVSGATWISHLGGSALHFDGTADRVTIPTSAALEPAQVSLAAWVRASSSPGAWRVIAFKGVTDCLASSYYLKSGASGGLVFGIASAAGIVLSPDAGTGVWDGGWHLATGVYDGAAVRLYVDGVQVGGGTATSVAITYSLANGSDFVVGHPVNLCDQPTQFTGDVDDVRVWGRALTTAEVGKLLPPFPSAITLESAPNPSVQGASISLTATVSPPGATGTVTFSDITGGGSVGLGDAPIVDGKAAISASFPTPGKRLIRATYGGDANYDPATSATLTQQVQAPSLTPTTTALGVAPNPVPAGSQTTFTATVSPIPSTGDVAWYVDGVKVGTTPVGVDGKAALNRTFADPGAHAIRANFVEGTLYADSQSPIVNITVSAVAYTVSITATPSVVVTGTTTHLVASVNPHVAGSFKLYANSILVGTQVITAGSSATWDPVVPAGTTQYRADFFATGSSVVGGSASIVVQGKAGTALYLTAEPLSVVSGEGLVTFTVTTDTWDMTGTVAIWDTTSTPRQVGSGSLVDDGDGPTASITGRLYGAGTHVLEARFLGDAVYAPATSAPTGVDVTADTGVNASGIGVSYTTFYPYKDGYRDSVAIRGTPREPVTVAIKVYNGAGKAVRSWALTSRTSAWSIAWNGRNAGGTLQATGKYRVVQTVRDAVGHSKAWTAYTVLSAKRLVWMTTTITKYADTGAVDGFNETGLAFYADAKYDRGYVLYADGCDYDWDYEETLCDVVVVTYRFTLPSAVKYASIRMAASGKAISGYGAGAVAVLGTNDNLHGTRSIGHGWSWYSSGTVGADGNVSGGGVVHGLVAVVGSNNGAIVYQKVRLTFRYARLH